MSAYQSCFRRYEVKFLLDPGQRARIEAEVRRHMRPDEHGESEVLSLYLDTPDFRVVRRSLERPVYKEKLRLRSYGPAGPGDEVFLELKKKYKGVVYKRRVALPRDEALAAAGGGPLPDCQIGREIADFLARYPGLAPRALISYRRDAWHDRAGEGLRVTFDRALRADLEAPGLDAARGALLLPAETSLMEVKTPGAVPLWLASQLSACRAYKQSFSKYGTAFTRLLETNDEEGPLCSQTCFPIYSPAARRPA